MTINATRVSATELARGLSDVLNRVHYRGERFVVERNGQVIAEIAPAASSRGITYADLLARVGDLHLPDPEFADDLEEIHRAQPRAEFPEWPN
jgi:antitoxin (DNA-binding transcriptional repressor) of toxin-antitoxin stability system